MTFFRLGSLPKIEIETHLKKSGFAKLEFYYKKPAKKEDQNCVSPGQFIKHYSPLITSYILTKAKQPTKVQINLKKTVLIDIGDFNKKLQNKVLRYLNLSPKNSLREAMTNLYYFLREGETTQTAETILITDLNDCLENFSKKEKPYFDSIFDKIYRSCSGRRIGNEF